MSRPAIFTQAVDLWHINATQTILLVFGLMIGMFLLTGGVIALNALIGKGDKKKVIRWLEARGCQVEKIQWVLAPSTSLRLLFLKYTSFEVHFLDSAGARHHATIVVPTWSSPEFTEDKIVG